MINQDNEDLWYDIVVLIKYDEIDEVKQMLSEHPELISECDSNTDNLMHMAIEENASYEMIKTLLNIGCDKNWFSEDSRKNVLSYLTYKNPENVYEKVKLLLEYGTDMVVKSTIQNPLFGAIENNNYDVAKLLIDNGIDLSQKYNAEDWDDALSYSKYIGRDKIAELIEKSMEEQGITRTPTSTVDKENPDQTIAYIEKHLGKTDVTIGEVIPSLDTALNVHIIFPKDGKDYYTLFTSGMSDKSMDYSEKDEEYKFAELMMKLPSSWKIDQEKIRDDYYNWPIMILKKVAYLAHSSDGYIDENTVIPNGEPGMPSLPFNGDTDLSCVMLCKSEDIPSYQYNDEIRIDFYTLIPISEEEIPLAKIMGSKAFMETLEKRDIADIGRALPKE